MYNGDITIKSCAAISCEYIHAYIYKYPTSSQIPARKLEICDLGVFPWFSVCFPWSPPTKKKTDVTLPRTNSWQLSGFPKKEIHEFSNPRVSGAVFILKGFSCLLFSRGAGSMMVHGWVHGQNGPSRIRSHSEFGEIPRLHRWSWTLSSPFQSLDISRRYDKIYHPKN